MRRERKEEDDDGRTEVNNKYRRSGQRRGSHDAGVAKHRGGNLGSDF